MCPECGEKLKAGSKSCKCGWSIAPLGRSAPVSDGNRFRCEWVAGGERCRYPGTSSHSTLGTGPWYCSGHFRSGGELGQRIVDESHGLNVRAYSAEAMVSASRSAYLDRAVPVMPRVLGVRYGANSLQSAAAILRGHMRQPGEEG